MSPFSRSNLTEFPNVRTVSGDVRDFAPEQLLREHGSDLAGEHGSYKVAGNLPYYVASPIVRHFLESDSKPMKMVVTVQREVGESMVAEPGKIGLLSLAVQVYGAPRIVAHIPAAKFHPKPKVDSVVVAIDVHPEPLGVRPGPFLQSCKSRVPGPEENSCTTPWSKDWMPREIS